MIYLEWVRKPLKFHNVYWKFLNLGRFFKYYYFCLLFAVEFPFSYTSYCCNQIKQIALGKRYFSVSSLDIALTRWLGKWNCFVPPFTCSDRNELCLAKYLPST